MIFTYRIVVIGPSGRLEEDIPKTAYFNCETHFLNMLVQWNDPHAPGKRGYYYSPRKAEPNDSPTLDWRRIGLIR